MHVRVKVFFCLKRVSSRVFYRLLNHLNLKNSNLQLAPKSKVHMWFNRSINNWFNRNLLAEDEWDPAGLLFPAFSSLAQNLCFYNCVTFIISSHTASLQTYCWVIAMRPTWLNVVPDNADVFISVRPCVFMPEADHMTQLVHHNAKLVTVFANGYGLGASATTTHVGAAPANQQHTYRETVSTEPKHFGWTFGFDKLNH